MPKHHLGRIRIGQFYEVNDIVLGQGSFSKVYLARHKVFGNFVALKVIDRNKIGEEYITKNLTREASILRKLKHPNIVNFYEEFSHDQLYCLSLELVDGYDLSRFLNKQESRKVTEKFAKLLFFQMVSAINYMHKAHVLHRDLKPENILLEHERVIKIVDFGLSNTYYPHTHLRTHCGSLEYAAPELFVHKSAYGNGVDLWSLGVILYSMVTGKMPFVVPKKSDGSYATSHKDKFHKRISQGLTEENWKQMEKLSYDCRNLLKCLLQPNQYRRLQIRDAYAHQWLQKESDLKKSLPQHRPDLQRTYKPEIMDWMADRLCVPKKRVQNHLATYKFDLISAIYYMMQDTLVKEVLYPPKDMKSSFIFRMNHRRRTTIYDTHENHEDSPTVGPYETPVSRGFEVDQPSHTLATKEVNGPGRMRQKGDGGFVFKPRENDPAVEDIRNRVGDGGHLDRTPKEKLSILKSNHAFSKQEDNLALKKDALKSSQRLEHQTYTIVNKPFRSYKHNRPTKAKDISGDSVVEALNGHYKVREENRKEKDPVDANGNLYHASNFSVNLNYQRNLKLLNEKYALKDQLPSKSIKPANRVQVQHRCEYKRKPLNGTHEENDTSANGNGLRDNRTSMNTNPISGKNSVKIFNAEDDSKDSHRQIATKLNSGEDYKASKISEQISTGRDYLKQFSPVQNQQHKQRYDNFSKTIDTVNTHHSNNKGQWNLRRNPKPAHVQVNRYADEFKKKPKYNQSFANKKSSSQVQVDVLQKSVLIERKEG